MRNTDSIVDINCEYPKVNLWVLHKNLWIHFVIGWGGSFNEPLKALLYFKT